MAPRKKPRRPVKKAVAKKANSKIGEAQKASVERRLERDHPRSQPIRPPDKRGSGDAYTVAEGSAQGGNPSLSDAARNTGELASKAMANPANKGVSGAGNRSLADAANKIVGLSAPVMKQMQADAKVKREQQNALTQTDLYGGSNKTRAARLAAMQNAYTDTANGKLKEQGQAVWMGPKKVKIRNAGPQRFDPENGSSTTEEVGGDEVLTKSELMSWLGDEDKVNQIMQVAQKAGLAVETYEDAAKLWSSVVDMAASSYSLAGKQVTPWALIQLRGKYAGPDGRMKAKVSTSTNIDEMDPAQARLMFEQTAMQALGRSPSKAEVDDFIAKAQTIAHSNPTVTTTTAQVGFDGKADTENSSSVTTGQGAAQAKSQLAAMDQAKQSEDYASYQAAGNYFPTLFEALQSPV